MSSTTRNENWESVWVDPKEAMGRTLTSSSASQLNRKQFPLIFALNPKAACLPTDPTPSMAVSLVEEVRNYPCPTCSLPDSIAYFHCRSNNLYLRIHVARIRQSFASLKVSDVKMLSHRTRSLVPPLRLLRRQTMCLQCRGRH